MLSGKPIVRKVTSQQLEVIGPQQSQFWLPVGVSRNSEPDGTLYRRLSPEMLPVAAAPVWGLVTAGVNPLPEIAAP